MLNFCHVCESNLENRFSDVKDVQTGDLFSLLVCENCGLGQTFASPENLAKYYAEYHGRRHGFTTDYCDWRRIRWVEKSVESHQTKKLLDIGCGSGTFLETAKRRGWQTVGTELNAEKFQDSGLEVHDDLDKIADKFAPESFDAITLWHTLEHFQNPREILIKARKMLAINGSLLAAVPNFGGFQSKLFGGNWLHLDMPRHLFHFSFESLKLLLKQCGFVVKWHRHQEFEYDLLGWSQSALNAFSDTPNVFFKTLAGQKNGISQTKIAVNAVFGAAFSAVAVPIVPLSALLKKGGTIVVSAKKS
jgi:2-polyprenyl-3-methyl-5-hydroxy-6-metoxy-1,4-benzoquinol methylase